ncbi:MAG: neutral/alkaline non-lysosomal ceramidase N-terminal domain-containing protein [Acidobacteria bacterium]|nr:neutral/alkaline non-lysosomal ceramidase N-terminal domain-containing protein [Acidobacteriota bacterium]
MPWQAQSAPTRWRAGVAVTDITPRESLWMAGYAARTRPAQGTALPLHAKALAIDDGRREPVVVVALDLLGVSTAMSAHIGAEVARQHRLPRQRLLLAASHTHSGPVVDAQLSVAYDLTDAQQQAIDAYTQALGGQVVRVVGEALQARVPATLHLGEATAGFAANRRVQYSPDGPVDQRVPMLRVDVDGKARAVLFSYACHNTTLQGDNVEWHGDYAGVAQATLESRHPGLTALFMSGCGADANPMPRGTRALVTAHGEALAAAVSDRLGAMSPIDGPLHAAIEQVDLPFAGVLTPEQWRQRFGLEDPYVARHARLIAALQARGTLPKTQPMPVQVWRFGTATVLVALGGEVVVDYAHRLAREHPDERVWAVGYANDVFGYVPSRRVLDEGGYEGGGAMLYYGRPGPFDATVEERIITAANRLIRSTR